MSNDENDPGTKTCDETVPLARTMLQRLEKNRVDMKLSDEELSRIMEQLQDVFFDTKEEQRKELGEKLFSENDVKVLISYLKNFTKNLTDSTCLERYDLLSNLQRVLQNFSDGSVDFAKNLGSFGAFSIILEAIDGLQKSFETKEEIKNIVMTGIDILHNCAKVPCNRRNFRNANAVPILSQFATTSDSEVKLSTILTLAYIINEGEEKLVSGDGGFLTSIIQCFKSLVAEYPKRHDGFSAKEIADGIRKIATHDKNKEKLVNEGILPILTELMEKGDDNEKEICAETVSLLAFSKANRKSILERKNLKTHLQSMLQSTKSSQEMKAIAAGAMWKLEGEKHRESPKLVTTPESDQQGDKGSHAKNSNEKKKGFNDDLKKKKGDHGHIMLSYNWNYQKQVLKIRQRLEDYGFDVWIDVEKMRGNLMDAMSKAVENASTVVMCVSQEYYESANCRMEAEYARKKKKHLAFFAMEPEFESDGWLGILMGMQYYYDFSKAENFEMHLKNFAEEINERRGTVEDAKR